MTDDERGDVWSLAVMYNSYLEASRNNSARSLSVWGGMLQRMQRRTGVSLVDDQFLSDRIRFADERLAKERAEAEAQETSP